MSRPTWKRMYDGLGVVAVTSVLAAALLGILTVYSYRVSVDHQRVWAERSASHSELARLAILANGPGNDVFATRTADAARSVVDELEHQFDLEFERSFAEIRSDPAAARDSQRVLAELQAARHAFDAMLVAERDLFAAMDHGDDAGAGVAMARMDRQLAQTSAAFARTAAEVRALQAAVFERHSAQVSRLKWGLYGVVAAVLVVVAGFVRYGQHLARASSTTDSEIEHRRAEVALLLNNVDQGFVTLDLDGRMSSTRSRAFEEMFGPPVAGGRFADQLSAVSPAAAAWFEVGWDALAEGLLPIELVLDQFPRAVDVDGRHIGLRYQPLLDGGELTGVLVVATDITARLQSERTETAQREAFALFQRALDDRLAVVEFAVEADRMVFELLDAPPASATAARLVHTLKGNAGIYSLTSLERVCHDYEDALVQGTVDETQGQAIAETWERVADTLRRMVGETRPTIELSEEDLAALSRAVYDRRPTSELAAFVQSFRLEPVRRRFERLAEQARALADRLHKGPIDVCLDDGGLRGDPRATGPLWSALVHVVRNAVDHGFDPCRRGVLALTAWEDRGAAVIEIADNGPGIDWDALRAKANRLGISSDADPTELLFVDGLSTKEHVTEISGRGVGLGAARAEVERLGGSVEVVSALGRGTRFVFRVPLERWAPSLPRPLRLVSRSRPPELVS